MSMSFDSVEIDDFGGRYCSSDDDSEGVRRQIISMALHARF